MTQRMLAARLRARQGGERGFTIVETMIAIGVIFVSLSAVAYTVTAGLRYIAHSRARIQATGLANEIIEEIRAHPYATIRRGMEASDLVGDPDAAVCGADYRFESCAGEKIVLSTIAGAYSADWIVPHTGTVDLDGLAAEWWTYITNEDITSNPYTVTVVVSWTGGSIPGNAGNVVQLQSKFFSPSGCQNTAVHPFAAPCQPFFYGLAQAPAARISISGALHLGAVDLTDAHLDLAGVEASGQQEQLVDVKSSAVATGGVLEGSTVETEGVESVTAEADSDPGSPTGDEAGATLTGAGASLERLQPDPSGEIGVRLTVPAATAGNVSSSSAATSADTYACPPEGTPEIDALACTGARVRQAGSMTAQVPFSHVVSSLGTANAVRVDAPASYTTAVVERDPVTGFQGLIDVAAARSFGTIYLGGFPTAGLTPPTGMSASAAVDTNYCVRISGYTESARVLVGERTATAPTNSVAGTVNYYNGSGFSSKTVTDSTLGTLAVTCQKTQVISGATVIWRVQVLAGGFTAATAPAPTQTTDPGDAQTRTEAEATTTPLAITMNYDLFVDGENEVDLTIVTDLDSIRAGGSYGQPPSP